MKPINSQAHLDALARQGTPARNGPSHRALLAAAMIEADLSQQDGWDHQPWLRTYREQVARYIDEAMTMACPPNADAVLDAAGILDFTGERVR